MDVLDQELDKALSEAVQHMDYQQSHSKKAAGSSEEFSAGKGRLCEPFNRWWEVLLLLFPATCYRQNTATDHISCCYHCVNPLTALMKDQVWSMTLRNVHAVYAGEVENASDVCSGSYQLAFLSPEMPLSDETWRDVMQNPAFYNHLIAFVVDEAHCVKQWSVLTILFNCNFERSTTSAANCLIIFFSYPFVLAGLLTKWLWLVHKCIKPKHTFVLCSDWSLVQMQKKY